MGGEENDGTALSATHVTGFISFTSPLAKDCRVHLFLLNNHQQRWYLGMR